MRLATGFTRWKEAPPKISNHSRINMVRVWSWITSKIQIRGMEMSDHHQQQQREKDRAEVLREEAVGKRVSIPQSAISDMELRVDLDRVMRMSYHQQQQQQEKDKPAQDLHSDMMKMRVDSDSENESDHQQQPEKDRSESEALREPQIDEPAREVEWEMRGIQDRIGHCDLEMEIDWDWGRAEALRESQNVDYDMEMGEGQARQHCDSAIPQSYNHDKLKLLQDAYLSIMNGGSAHHDPENVIFTQEKSPMGNTVLHIAAMYGNDEWVEKTCRAEQAHSLLIAQNNNGDTPLHLAARNGHVSTIKLFIAHLNSLPFAYSNEPKMYVERTLLVKNNQGNNFFHEALNNGHEGVMSLLFSDEQLDLNSISGFKDLVFRLAITQTNNESKSVLYLAVEAGYMEFVDQALVKLGINALIDDELFPKGDVVAGKSPLLAAIFKRDQGIIDIIVKRMPEWIQLRDNEGRTPLHHAASIGYLDGVKYLLGKCVTCASVRDNYGFFPLHLASDGGHVEVVHKLLELNCCPYPREMLDNGSRNILHLAIQNGKFNVVRYILQASNTELEKMINGKDNEGNTPLHLASLLCYPRIVHELTWDKRVDLTLVKNMHHTALDACMQFPIENMSLRQRLTWIALKSADVKSRLPLPLTTKVPSQSKESHWKHKALKMDNYKDKINILLLVSTLIITATFAVGFAMPGGINSSNPGMGMSLLLDRVWFKLFIFCITISMYCAISVTIILIWAQLGDITLSLLALKVAMPILGITLATLSIAFLVGVHLVITDLSWLATTSLVISVIFILILLLLYFLLWLPSSSIIPIVRYISYYPFLLLASLVAQGETSGNHKHLDSNHSVPAEV